MATINNLVAAPGVPAILPGDSDGLLDATQIDEHLLITIPSWGDNPTSDNETLWVNWAREESPDQHIELEKRVVVPGSSFPLQVHVPRQYFLQGRLLVTYQVENQDLNRLDSEARLITLDTIPPYGNDSPESLIVPPGADVIDDAYLEAHDGTVVLTVPTGYLDQSADDVVLFFWMKEIPGNPETFPPPSVPPFTIGQGTAIVALGASRT